MQRSAVVVVADKTSLKRPFIFANVVHMVGRRGGCGGVFSFQKATRVQKRPCSIGCTLCVIIIIFFFFAVIDAENGAQPSCVTLALFFDVLLLQQK